MAVQFPEMTGRHALVTGASAGIGKATCEALLEQGVVVVGLALDDQEPGPSGRFHPVACDLAAPGSVREALASIKSIAPALDYVVNVAGRDAKRSLEEGDERFWTEIVDLNLRAYYMVIREALPLLRLGRGKAIVNVSSINYRLGVPRRSVYSTTKAGILGLTTGLARELGAEGIRINTISPGWVFTDRQVQEYFARPEDQATYLPYLHERQAINHHITPLDVANHILFYLSSASAASTGHNCVVDAGWLLE